MGGSSCQSRRSFDSGKGSVWSHTYVCMLSPSLSHTHTHTHTHTCTHNHSHTLTHTTHTHTHTQWLAVQERWRQLESVLTTPSAAKSFTEEATIFTAITSSWVELMTSARVSPGVVERCDGEVCVGKVCVGEVLGGLGERLEQCKKSLSLYLLSKRQVSKHHTCSVFPDSAGLTKSLQYYTCSVLFCRT